jgi:hypothetical protein
MKSWATAGRMEQTMRVGVFEADFALENIMRLLRTSILGVLVLAAIALALVPQAVLAEERKHIGGTFTVSYMYRSALDYCVPSGGDVAVEAQGIGNIPGLGPLFLTVKKCFTIADGTYAGTFTMAGGNGDMLTGTYAGTKDSSLVDENGYFPFQGTLTVTGGTGRFQYARGRLRFTAVASPGSVSVTSQTVNGVISTKTNGMAFYLVQGNMLSPEKH